MPVVAKVKGLDEAVAYLKVFDQETLKAMNKEMYSVMKGLVQESRSMVPTGTPMSGWGKKSLTGGLWASDLAYTQGKVRTGIKSELKPVRLKGLDTKERAYLLVQGNAAGAIFEAAGRKNRNGQPWNPKSTSKKVSHSTNPNAGKQFIENIVNFSGSVVIGKQGRIVWKSVQDNRAEITAKMAAVVAKYQAMINAKLARS